MGKPYQAFPNGRMLVVHNIELQDYFDSLVILFFIPIILCCDYPKPFTSFIALIAENASHKEKTSIFSSNFKLF